MGRMYACLVPVSLLLMLGFPTSITAFLINPQVRSQQTSRAVRRSSSARSPMPQRGDGGWRHRIASTREAMIAGDTTLQEQIRIGGREGITPIGGTQAAACRTFSTRARTKLQAAAAPGSEEGNVESFDGIRSSLTESASTAREVEVGPSSTVTFDAPKISEGRKRSAWSPPSRWEKAETKQAGVGEFGLPATVTERMASAAPDGNGPATAAPSTLERGSENAARGVGASVVGSDAAHEVAEQLFSTTTADVGAQLTSAAAALSDELKQPGERKRSSWNPHSRWSRSGNKSEGRRRSVTKDSGVAARDEAAADVSSTAADIAGSSASTAAAAARTAADGGDAPISPSAPTTTREEHNGKKLDEIRATMMASEKAREIAERLRQQSSGGDEETQRIRTAASSIASIAKNGSGRVVAGVEKRARAATSFAKRASQAGGNDALASDTAGNEGIGETAGGALMKRVRRARGALAATVKTVGRRVRETGGRVVSTVGSGGAKAWQRITRVVRGSRDQPQGENRD